MKYEKTIHSFHKYLLSIFPYSFKDVKPVQNYKYIDHAVGICCSCVRADTHSFGLGSCTGDVAVSQRDAVCSYRTEAWRQRIIRQRHFLTLAIVYPE